MTNEVKTRPSPPRRRPKEEAQGPPYLTEEEVEGLIKAAGKAGRHGHRDATMILVAYSHGLRATELCRLRWDSVNLKAGTIYIKRLKGSDSGTHPIRRREAAALKKLCPAPTDRRGPVFRTERGTAISRRGFHQVIARAGELAGFTFPVHPHLLRHGCGYKLTNEGHDTRGIQAWLGHKNIQHTVHYTKLAPDRFSKLKFWED
jgi:site-specific recombinase XerD